METMNASYVNRVWIPSNCSCDLHPQVTHIDLFNHTITTNICNLPLVPSWLLAVILGLSFGSKFFHLGQQVTGSLAYSVTYLMYAAMITSGLVVHCLFLVECDATRKSQYYLDAARIDASLTSCIAVSFAFNGLIDLKVIPERSCATMTTMACFYGFIFYAYFTNLSYTLDLYFNSILLGCSFYMLTQLIHLIIFWSHTNWLEVAFFVAAGIAGGSSLLVIREDYCWLCNKFGPWSIEGVWYYGSDITMILLGMYIWKSRILPKQCNFN